MKESTLQDDESQKPKELYQLAQRVYDSAEKRFDDAEGKIGRYLSILFIMLGLATASTDKLRTIISNGTIPNIVFGILIVFFYFFGLIAFCYFVRAIQVQQVRDLKLGKPVIDYFQKYTASASLAGLADAFFGAAEHFRNRTKEKLRLARIGFKFLLFAVGLAVAAACSYYLVIDLPKEPKMTLSTNGGGNGDSQQTTNKPSSEPSNDSTQAAKDAAELFEDMQKSFEGSKK